MNLILSKQSCITINVIIRELRLYYYFRCVVLLLVMCLTGAAGSTIWLNSYVSAYNDKVPFLTYVPATDKGNLVLNSPDFEGFLNFWTYVIVLQVSR